MDERKKVELEDVAQCVSKKREENVFDLTESLGEGDARAEARPPDERLEVVEGASVVGEARLAEKIDAKRRIRFEIESTNQHGREAC